MTYAEFQAEWARVYAYYYDLGKAMDNEDWAAHAFAMQNTLATLGGWSGTTETGAPQIIGAPTPVAIIESQLLGLGATAPVETLVAPPPLYPADPAVEVPMVYPSYSADPAAMEAPTDGVMASPGALYEEPGADLRDTPLAGVPVEGTLLTETEITVDDILKQVGMGILGAKVVDWIASTGASRIGWSAMPTWLKGLLIAAGIAVGTTIVVLGAKRLLGGGGDGPPGVQVVGSWNANGVKFYRLADGRLAVQNKRGRWKLWRPKKPIVLMPGGANNLRTMLRADATLDRQARRIAKVLNRRGQARRPARRSQGDYIALPTGQQIVKLGG